MFLYKLNVIIRKSLLTDNKIVCLTIIRVQYIEKRIYVENNRCCVFVENEL